MEASKAKLQKEFNQNEVSVQTLQVRCIDDPVQSQCHANANAVGIHAVTQLVQSVVKEQQRRVSALETEVKAKDNAHGTLQTKLEELQASMLLLHKLHQSTIDPIFIRHSAGK